MRHAVAALAVLLSTLLVPLGITSTWLSLRVNDTEAYLDAVEPLAVDEQLRSALAVEVAEAAIATIDSAVPLGLMPDAVDDLVRSTTEDVVESDAFPAFWRQANADAHREFLAIVAERDEDVVADGFVVIDLGPLLDAVLADFAAEYGIPAELLPSVPLPLPVVAEARLEQARGAYRVLDGAALWVPLLWAALVAVAVATAPGLRGRIRTGAACAIGVGLGGALVLLLVPPTVDALAGQVEPAKQELTRLLLEVILDSLDRSAVAAAVGGPAVGVGLLAASLLPARRSRAGHP